MRPPTPRVLVTMLATCLLTGCAGSSAETERRARLVADMCVSLDVASEEVELYSGTARTAFEAITDPGVDEVVRMRSCFDGIRDLRNVDSRLMGLDGVAEGLGDPRLTEVSTDSYLTLFNLVEDVCIAGPGDALTAQDRDRLIHELTEATVRMQTHLAGARAACRIVESDPR